MNRQPLFLLVICFILGIFFQEKVVLSGVWVSGLLIGALVLSAFSFLIKKFWRRNSQNALLCLLFFCVGIFLHHSKRYEMPDLKLKSSETVVMKLSKKLNSNLKNKRYEVEAWTGEKHFGMVVSVPNEEKELEFGKYYRAKTLLYIVEPLAYDFQFDYRKYLSRKGIFVSGYLPEGFEEAENPELGFNEKIQKGRQILLHRIDEIKISPHSREFLKGIILADRTEMDEQTVSDFNRTGLVHLLAISGSHMVILFFAFLFTVNLVLRKRYRRLSIVLALVFIWCFSIFIDYGSSVMRSCIMLSVYYVYVLLQRKPSLVHAMALAAFILLVYDTNQLFDVGFQMSFAAVLGIFWLNQPLLSLFPENLRRHSVFRFFVSIFTITLSAQMATLPLVLYYFHQFSLVSVAANIVIIPFSEIVIVFSLILTLIIAFGWNLPFLFGIYDRFVKMILEVIHAMAGWSDGNSTIPFSLAEALVLFVLVFLIRSVILKFQFRSVWNFCAVFLCFVLIRQVFGFYYHQKNEILVHKFYKNQLFSIKQNDEVYFYRSEKSDSIKIKKFIIEPYTSSRRIGKVHLITLPLDVSGVQIGTQKYMVK